jgi:RNA polymerase sigma-70 factor (ECF subfamily)
MVVMDEELRDRACDRAYRDHAADVYRVAYAILRDPDDALDATHDAFARAWERWEQYDSQRPLRPWLHGIVVHLALDRLRRRRVRQLLGHPPGPLASDPASSADLASDVVKRRLVEQAMAELRPQSRAALVLRHYYGYEYAQIAEFLGVASGTVGATISRAHAFLRERLAADFPSAPRPSPSNRSVKAVERSTTPPEVMP